MDSRTITLIASIAVIGIVAIGAGYAYTALTINDDNSATAQYVTLTQSPGYTFTVNPDDEFDSCTDDTHYAKTGNSNIAGFKVTNPISVSEYKLANLGQEVTITATATGFTTDPSLVLKIDNAKSSGFTPGTNMTYYLVNGSNVVAKLVDDNGAVWKNAAGTAEFSMNFDALNASTHDASIALKLCYGYKTDVTMWNPFNAAAGEGYVCEVPANLTTGIIVFSATEAPAQNP